MYYHQKLSHSTLFAEQTQTALLVTCIRYYYLNIYFIVNSKEGQKSWDLRKVIEVWVFWIGGWIHALLPTSSISACVASGSTLLPAGKQTCWQQEWYQIIPEKVVMERKQLCVCRNLTNLSCYQVDVVNELYVEYFVVCHELDVDSLVTETGFDRKKIKISSWVKYEYCPHHSVTQPLFW